MFEALFNKVSDYRRDFCPNAVTILEFGSADVNGSVRPIFSSPEIIYTGYDREPGPGVDKCLNLAEPEALILGPVIPDIKKADVIICLETLEHLQDPFPLLHLIEAFQRRGSWLIISTPTTGFPLHRHPRDYFRFMPDAFTEIFFKVERYDTLNRETIYTEQNAPVIVGIACHR